MGQENGIQPSVRKVKGSTQRVRKRVTDAEAGIVESDSRHSCRLMDFTAHRKIALIRRRETLQNHPEGGGGKGGGKGTGVFRGDGLQTVRKDVHSRVRNQTPGQTAQK